MPRRKQPAHRKPSGSRGPVNSPRSVRLDILCKVAEPGQGELLPEPAERQAEVERVLGLGPGDLSPERVAHRQQEHNRRLVASIEEGLSEILDQGGRRVHTR